MHAGIGMDVWAVDAQATRLIEEALTLGGEMTLSVRQGMPLRFTKHQVLAAYTAPLVYCAATYPCLLWRLHLRPHHVCKS